MATEMTTEQLKMNSELFGLLQDICANEKLMSKAISALRRVLKRERETQDALMTKEELDAKMERGEEAYRMGECGEMMVNEDLTAYLKRRGYNV